MQRPEYLTFNGKQIVINTSDVIHEDAEGVIKTLKSCLETSVDISSEIVGSAGVGAIYAKKLGKLIYIQFQYTPQNPGNWEENFITIPSKYIPNIRIPFNVASYVSTNVDKGFAAYIDVDGKSYFRATDFTGTSGYVLMSLAYILP